MHPPSPRATTPNSPPPPTQAQASSLVLGEQTLQAQREEKVKRTGWGEEELEALEPEEFEMWVGVAWDWLRKRKGELDYSKEVR